MTRVLLRFEGPKERRTAAHRAALFARRGIDVDLIATRPSAIARTAYDLVLDAVSVDDHDILAMTPSGSEGVVRIVGAQRDDAPAPAPRPRTPWVVPAGLLVAIVTALSLGGQGAPPAYAVLLALITGVAAIHVFRTLHAPPRTSAHAMQPEPTCPIPSHDAGSSVSPPFSFR